MTITRTALRGLLFYRRTCAAVALGVASAVAVLAGAWLVGHSVTRSLATLVERRLGRTEVVVAAETPFTDSLAERLRGVPLLAIEGVVQHQASARRAGPVQVYGVDERFFAFHEVDADPPRDSDAFLSPDLAAELGASDGDALLVRVTRPTDIPLDSLHGRKEDVGRTVRLRFRSVLPRASLGEFALTPRQGPVRAVFVPLSRLQRDLAVAGRVNTVLLSVSESGTESADRVRQRLASALNAADLGLTFTSAVAKAAADKGSTEHRVVLVESSSGLIPETVEHAVIDTATRDNLPITPVLTWLANKIATPTRSVPYSLVSAIGRETPQDPRLGQLLQSGTGDPPIVLNEWAANDLSPRIGDPITLDFYRWVDEGRLVTESMKFRYTGSLPIAGLTADLRLAPEYPGMTESKRVADWDPPFPIDLRLVRPKDEAYWDQYRATPKAFIPLEVGQRIWRTRYGRLTSLRIGPVAGTESLDDLSSRLSGAVVNAIDPIAAGLTVVDVRRQQQAASAGATDFGAYFSYFSFFLVVSALLLAALFFRLSIEQRLPQIGLLRASGFSLGRVRQLFLVEGAVVAIIGGVLGVVLAIGWAALMMYGLRTWWVGAVGTTSLELAIDPGALAAGAAMGIVMALIAIAITIRGLSQRTPRALLSGAAAEPALRRRTRAWIVFIVSAAGALSVSALAVIGVLPAAAGFFGAGTLTLVSGLCALALRLKKGAAFAPSLLKLASRNASWRPGRSLTSAGLVAAAVFLLVSVDTFRKAPEAAADRHSGTGGFALIAESALPLIHDPGTEDGREALGLPAAASSDDPLNGVAITPLRLRPGDDASCLNLYQPKRPRVLAIPPALIEANRFRFGRTLASSPATEENPWRLLGPPDANGSVPAIVDETSLQYVLHASVGDEIVIDADTTTPRRLRIVAALRDSVLQGEILVAESAFLNLFPDVEGFRMLLVDVSPLTSMRVNAAMQSLEERLEAYGVDAQETLRRLEAYHRVENTYLSTFQALGGLGLVLGVIGLSAVIARNVLERRRELALLNATGFSGSHLRTMVALEQLGLLVVGVAIGLAAALIAIAPVIVARGGQLPALSFVWIGLVLVAGIASTLWATRQVRRLPLVASLRSE